MKAMVLIKPRQPLQLCDYPIPQPGKGQVLLKVQACAVCRTDLHIIDGELNQPKLPLIPGHQIVGTVAEVGAAVTALKLGQQVGVPWLGYHCGSCRHCQSDQENLCDKAQFTGYQLDGGFAEYCVANADYCFPVPPAYSALQAAPLLCAGIIGYRAYRKTGTARHIGLYGFGAAAHILTQVAVAQQRQVYAFTRKNDTLARQFALQLGAVWAGDSSQVPPCQLDAAILFAPAGELIPVALKVVAKGGKVICAGIHMSDIPSFPYQLLWGERCLESVANLTRNDGRIFLALAPKIPVSTEIHTYPLAAANQALDDLRYGRFTGSAVINLSSG